MIFNQQNLVQADKDWPTKGFLRGTNLIHQDYFNAIEKFDYSMCTSPAFLYGGRKSMTFMYGKKPARDEACQALQELTNELSSVELLVDLVTRALDGVEEEIWAKNIQMVREMFLMPIVLICTDSQAYEIAIHHDYSPATQIYLGPEGADCGTKFHKFGEPENFQQLPFIPNSGYFNINSRYGQHSAHGKPGITRKTLMIFWLLHNPNKIDLF